MKPSFSVDILAFGAHPDDVEFACGGLLLHAIAQGQTVKIVHLTRGDKGSNGDVALRQQEAIRAAAVIGASCEFLNFKDCEINDTQENRLELVRVIRSFRPRLVLAPHFQGQMNHPDHLITGQLLRIACRLARFAKILPQFPIHWIKGILHYLPWGVLEPDFLVDISSYVPKWREAMSCHASQMKTFDYIDWNLKIAARLGQLIGVEYAQGLIKANPIQIDDLLSIAQGTREI